MSCSCCRHLSMSCRPVTMKFLQGGDVLRQKAHCAKPTPGCRARDTKPSPGGTRAQFPPALRRGRRLTAPPAKASGPLRHRATERGTAPGAPRPGPAHGRGPAEGRAPHSFWLRPVWLLGWKSLTMMPSWRMFSTNFSRCSSSESNFSAMAEASAAPLPPDRGTGGGKRRGRPRATPPLGSHTHPAIGHAPSGQPHPPGCRPRPPLGRLIQRGGRPRPLHETTPTPGAGHAPLTKATPTPPHPLASCPSPVPGGTGNAGGSSLCACHPNDRLTADCECYIG